MFGVVFHYLLKEIICSSQENICNVVGRVLSSHWEEVGSSQVVGKGGGRAREMKMGRAKPFHPLLAML